MEEMQQSVETELQNDQTQEQVGQQEPTNREILEAMIGLNNPTTDNQTGEDDTITDDESEEMQEEEAESKPFYTASELFTLIKNNQEIDDSRMTDELRELQNSMLDYKKSLQGDYTKKTQKLAEEKKTLDEELQAFQERQELAKLEQEAQNNGLSSQDLIEINRIAKDYFIKNGEEYDPSNEEHRILYEDIKKYSIDTVTSQRKANKIKNDFNTECERRYGDKLLEVQEKAKQILNKYEHEKALAIEQALSNYDTNVAYALLDEAYRQLQQQPQQAQQPAKQKPITLPPHSVGRSNVVPKAKQKQKEWQKYF